MDADRLSQRFTSWRQILASLPDGDIEARINIFEDAIKDVAGYVAEGLDKVQGVDELHGVAQTYGLVGHLGEDDVQARIARGFENMVPDLPADWGEPQGWREARGYGQTPPRKPEPPAQPPVGTLGEWDAGDDPGPIPPRKWLLGNQFCRTFISSIVAAGGTGKTALRLVQFISLALGRSLCGQHVFRRSRVLLINLEDDTDEMQRRIKAVLDHYGINRAELKGWLSCATPKLDKIAMMQGKVRARGPLAQQIYDAIARCKPDLISLDPFVKTHSLEENDSGDMDFVCDLLAQIAVSSNVAVDSPHHVHKGTITPGDADSGRGSSGIRDAGRLNFTLCTMTEEEAALFAVPLEDRHAYVRLDPAKVNITPHSAKAEWFRLVGVPIGNGTPEYPNGDTIQVAEPWTPPDTWEGLSSEAANRVLTKIDAGLENGQRYSDAGSAKVRAAWPLVQQACPEKPAGQCREIIRTWVRNGVLEVKKYDDPVRREPENGLFVNQAKRPGPST